MAVLISRADGNWNTAATWGVVETGTGAQQTSMASNTSTTTTYVACPAFTCTNADVMEGILLYCRKTATSPAGTLTVGLSDNNGSTYAREVVVNAADLPTTPGWVFFKFGTTLTADGGTDYRIAVKSSTSGTVTFWRSATTADWVRYIRLSAAPAGSPQADDIMFVAGELTGQGTHTTDTVTYDQVSPSPDYGAIAVCARGLLQFGTSASTAYELKTSAIMYVYALGELTVGTTSSRIPSTSSALLLFDCVTNAEFGLYVRGTLRMHGAVVGEPYARLSANAAIGATTLTLDRTVTWKSGNTVLIPSSDGDTTHWEERTLNGDASGNSLTLSSGLTYAHLGTNLVPTHVILYDRNIKFRGVDNTKHAFLGDSPGTGTSDAVIELSWSEFYWLGNGNNGTYGFQINNAATIDIQYCCIRNFENNNGAHPNIGSAAASQNLTFDYNTICRMRAGNVSGPQLIGWRSNQGTQQGRYNVIAVGGNFTLDSGKKGTWTYNTLYNYSFSKIRQYEVDYNYEFVFQNNEFGTLGDLFTFGTTITFYKFKDLKFHEAGLKSSTTLQSVIFENLQFKETGTYCLDGVGSTSVDVLYLNCVFDCVSSSYCVLYNNDNVTTRVRFVNCEFLSATVADVRVYVWSDLDILFDNCLSTTPTAVSQSSGYSAGSDKTGIEGKMRYMRYNRVDGNHFTITKNGNITRDTVIYETPATSSERVRFITNTAAEARPLPSSVVRKFVAEGQTPIISVRVRKSSSGDSGGANYNGIQPRLVMDYNGAAQILTQVTSSASAAVGTWETLTVTGPAVALDDTVVEAWVELFGDGSTVGWVNVGEWS